MTRNLGGPRVGNCRSRSWLTTSEHEPLPEHRRDDTDHGVMPWADFIDSMVAAGAARPTFDLFDVRQPDGGNRRYRVISEGFLP